jgi:hypothetical protein
MKRFAILALLGLTGAAPAPASPAPAPLACDGQVAIIYHSKIKPGGSLAGLTEALRAEEAWYRAQGVTSNRFVLAKVIVIDKTTKQQSYAADEVYTLHINPPAPERYKPAPKSDYPAKFRANATTVDRRTVCLPKL